MKVTSSGIMLVGTRLRVFSSKIHIGSLSFGANTPHVVRSGYPRYRAYFLLSFFSHKAVLGFVRAIHVHAVCTFFSVFLYFSFINLSFFLHKILRFRSLFETSYVKKLLTMLFSAVLFLFLLHAACCFYRSITTAAWTW